MFPGRPAPTRLDVGRTLNRAFSLLGRNPVSLLVSALLLVGLPLALLGWAQTSLLGNPVVGAGAAWTTYLFLPVNVVAGALLQSSVIYGAVNDWNGQKADLGATLRAAFARLLPLIGVSILAGLATGLAAILLIVPGIMVAVAYEVATPVVVMERGRGVFGSLSRSADLTRGDRWPIFGILALLFILGLVFSAIQNALIAAFNFGSPLAALRVATMVGTPLTQAFTTLLGALVSASIYYELRNNKEGVGAEVLASVFD
ncbi:MAG: hypothetical protein JSR86_12290 [Proteobacteria bacterium]|nr:hypothetical protein [Pseudomonadota bacterium]